MPRKVQSRWWSVGLCLALLIVTLGADIPHAQLLKEIQGRWVRRAKSGDQVITIVKEYKGQQTLLTATGAGGEILHQHSSEFELRALDGVLVYTYKNRKVLAGPGKGKFEPNPVPYIYRIRQGKFFEIRGAHEGDPAPPDIIIWERPAADQAG